MCEDTHLPLICEVPPARQPDVTVTIPGELAEALVRFGPPLLEHLRREHRFALIDSEAARRRHEEERARHRAITARLAVRAFRAWRRIEAATADRLERDHALDDLCADLAPRYGVPTNREWVRFLITERRKAVNDYIKARRTRTLVRMFLDGRSNAEIAGKLGLSTAYTAKLVRVHRPDIDAARRERRA